MIGKCCKKNVCEKASARVVDGKLILSLPAANTPVVWQMDLGHAKASALEVRHNEESGLYTLTLKTPKGEVMDVAAFAERRLSLEGLMAASKALENAHGQIKQGCANDCAPVQVRSGNEQGAPQKTSRALIVVLALLGLLGLFLFWSAQMPVMVGGEAAPGGAERAASAPKAGVPLSADSYLQNH